MNDLAVARPVPSSEASHGPSIVLIGLMGAGKTCVGRRLAKALGLGFVDADDEITAAAGCSIADIFETWGEPAFRDLERKVIARLLSGERKVVATGGGAYMTAETRAHIREHGLTIWLRAELDLLVKRTTTSRRGILRPLLDNENPRATLDRLMKERYPVYAEADLVIETRDESPEATVARIVETLSEEPPR